MKEIERLEKKEKERNEEKGKDKKKGKAPLRTQVKSPSDTTLYTPALRRTAGGNGNNLGNVHMVNQISDFVDKMRIDSTERSRTGEQHDQQPMSAGESPQTEPRKRTSAVDEGRNQAERLIIEAEQFKAAVEAPEGMVAIQHCSNNNFKPAGNKGPVTDEDFFYLTCHVEKGLQAKIEKGEYVDLEKLLPQDRLQRKQADKLTLVHRDGDTFFTPEDSGKRITNVRRWEQAFRVYATVYCRVNPGRAGEIWQYIDVINTAAAAYIWEDVASYDYTFRQLMEFNSNRSWATTYNQMWNLCFRHPIPRNPAGAGKNWDRNNESNGDGRPRYRHCWSFNKGKCKFGAACKFDNRCRYCDSTRHGINTCPKAEKNGNVSSNVPPTKGGNRQSGPPSADK